MNNSRFLTIFLIFVSCILLYLLFTTSPMYIDEQFKKDVAVTVDNKLTELAKDSSNEIQKIFIQGLKVEVDKANSEIQSRLDHEFEWLRLKYYVIGALFLGFLYHAFLKNSSTQNGVGNGDEDFNILKSRLTSATTSFVLALTVLVGVTVDMQIRSGRIVIDQLGNWIYLYAEPIFLGKTTGTAKDFGWEQFLRLQGGYHHSTLYALSFWPNIYYLSIVLYAFYLFSATEAIKNCSPNALNANDTKLLWLGFGLLHGSLLVCALSSHIIPSIFRVTAFPVITGWGWFEQHDTNPNNLVFIYFVAWTLLTYCSYTAIKLNKTYHINRVLTP